MSLLQKVSLFLLSVEILQQESNNVFFLELNWSDMSAAYNNFEAQGYEYINYVIGLKKIF